MASALADKVKGANWKAVLFGDYDYKFLCYPQIPYWSTPRQPLFYGKDEKLPVFLAIVMGLQHALAMVGGLITPPLIIGLASPDPAVQRYLINAALICSGMGSMVQVMQVKIPLPSKYFKGPLVIGTGLLSVVGISFAYVGIVSSSVAQQMKHGVSFNDAYGKMLGTIALCSPVLMAISRLPPAYMRRIFSPIVAGIAVTMIGISLTATGIEYWGGGVVCAQTAMTGAAPSDALCTFSDGDVNLPFGSPEYVGLGFSVFAMLFMIELFGSPFLKNISVFCGLMFGYIVAAIATHDGASYIDTGAIASAPGITFLWTTTFKYGIYGAAIIPTLIGMIQIVLETVGDVSATAEASMLEVIGDTHQARIASGMLSDGISTLFSALAGVPPVTTYAQNNGIISLTRVAARTAGFGCAIWLFSCGVIAKIGGWVQTIPDCVLGGMTTFLFANVTVSGIRIMLQEPLTRRNRFIAAVALGLGVGITIVPQWGTYALWPATDNMSSFVLSLNETVQIILDSGFMTATFVAVILNAIIPPEVDHQMMSYELENMKRYIEHSQRGMKVDTGDNSTASYEAKPMEEPKMVDEEDPTTAPIVEPPPAV